MGQNISQPNHKVCERFARQVPRRGLWGFDGLERLDREFDKFEISMNSMNIKLLRTPGFDKFNSLMNSTFLSNIS